jgi:hypothetical protein
VGEQEAPIQSLGQQSAPLGPLYPQLDAQHQPLLFAPQFEAQPGPWHSLLLPVGLHVTMGAGASHAVAPLFERSPAGHASHAAALLLDLYCPAAHGVHAAALLLDLYCPAAHGVHASRQRHGFSSLQSVLLLLSVLSKSAPVHMLHPGGTSFS